MLTVQFEYQADMTRGDLGFGDALLAGDAFILTSSATLLQLHFDSGATVEIGGTFDLESEETLRASPVTRFVVRDGLGTLAVSITGIENTTFGEMEQAEFLDAFDEQAAVGVAISGSRFGDLLVSLQGRDEIHGNSGDDELRGGAGDDMLFGDAGHDSLNGGGGADVLDGGRGNDSYFIDSTVDRIIEGAGSGADTVRSQVSFTLPANVESLLLAGSQAAIGTGNSGNNTLIGNAAANTLIGLGGDDFLDGRGGNDTLRGGSGDDTFVVGESGDRPLETAAGGIDLVRAAVNYTLGNHIEVLVLTGSAGLRGTGNGLPNSITGNSAANVLVGGAGDDTLQGRGGDDTLRGGTGNDTYIVERADDLVIEHADQGTDTVAGRNGVVLGAHLEKLLLLGSGPVSGTGNRLDNTLTGNEGNNVLDGADGGDVMRGGLGSDTYRVDSAGDRVIEVSGAGRDSVHSAIDYSLGANVENLYLLGTLALDGAGNALNNRLFGNPAGNVLSGNGGDDRLDGGGGSDRILGGAGNDILIIDTGDAERLDGGIGEDALRITGNDTLIDLAVLNGGVEPVVVNIEVIDLSAPGVQTVKLDALALLSMTGSPDPIRVNGDSNDAVELAGTWINKGLSGAYIGYESDGTTVLVEAAIQQGGIETPNNIMLAGLDGADGFRLDGDAINRVSGYSVSAAGDVNGDGFADLMISSIGLYHFDAGAVYVVFGDNVGFDPVINLSELDGNSGFRIDGMNAGDKLGFSVSSAGDVNGDGLADLQIGAFGFTEGGADIGASYLIHGSDAGFASSFELSALNGTNGFRLDGAVAGEQSGRAVSGAGDVNGDGLADLLIMDRSGTGHVIFGNASGFPATGDFSGINGQNGFSFSGLADDFRIRSLDGAGDVNGDGYADLLFAADSLTSGQGEGYVVFGTAVGFLADFAASDLAGSNGFRITGLNRFDGINDTRSRYVSGAGDVNGDGFDDLIIGTRYADTNDTDSGAAYVVFGKSGGFIAEFAIGSLDGSNGFKLSGFDYRDNAGSSVSGAGDVNGDGYADLLIGASRADGNFSNSGVAYLVFGRADGFSSSLELSALNGDDGFRLSGAGSLDYAGFSVSGAGDIDGDGFDDLIIGAPSAGSGGASYVIYGRDFADAVPNGGTEDDDELVGTVADDVLIGGTGNDHFDGAGGSDVLKGGAGNDTFVFDSHDRFVEGDYGMDTLRVAGDASEVDFSSIPVNALTGLEIIDLGGDGSQSAILTALEVLNLSDTTNTLRIDGTADDAVHFGAGWVAGDDITIGAELYHQWTQGEAILQIDADIIAGV